MAGDRSGRATRVAFSPSTGLLALMAPLYHAAGSVLAEVVAALVRAGLLFLELHQHVVEQRGGAEAEEVGGEPVVAQRLLDEAEVVERLLGGPDAACGLHPDALAGAVVEIA